MSLSICKNATELAKWCAAGACSNTKNNKVRSLGFAIGAVAFGAMAYLAAKATVAPEREEGEEWMGHFYPYSKYPHGHFDCAHGSTEYEHMRSMDNERRRDDVFERDGVCTRGINEISRPVFDSIGRFLYTSYCTPQGYKITKRY